MNKLMKIAQNRARRKRHVRARVLGTHRPRLTVFVSNRHVSAQIIDDTKQITLVHITTVGQKNIGSNLTEKATWVGIEVAKKARAGKIKKVVFDRNSRLYHGRVKALAEAAREGGLEF